jgi:hypothetical protein
MAGSEGKPYSGKSPKSSEDRGKEKKAMKINEVSYKMKRKTNYKAKSDRQEENIVLAAGDFDDGSWIIIERCFDDGCSPESYILLNKRLSEDEYTDLLNALNKEVHGSIMFFTDASGNHNVLPGFPAVDCAEVLGWNYSHAGDYVGVQSRSPTPEWRILLRRWTTDELIEDMERALVTTSKVLHTPSIEKRPS